MHKVTWRGVKEHPVRFAMAILAVVLGVAFLTATFALRTMMSNTLETIVDTTLDADAYIRGVSATTTGPDGETQVTTQARMIDMSLADDAAAANGVAEAVPVLRGPVVLVGADKTMVHQGQAPSIAIGASNDPTITVLDGRLPDAASSEEIALERDTAARSGLNIGDTTVIVLNGKVLNVTVVGLVEMDTPLLGTTVVIISNGAAIAAFAPGSLVSEIAVFGAGDNVDETALAESVRQALPEDTPADIEVVTGDQARAEASRSTNVSVGFLTALLLVFGALALFVGAFLIANTFAMSARERAREIAVLRAVGASPRQVFGSVVGQAFIVGVIGAAIGVVAGFALVRVLRALLASQDLELVGGMPIEPATIAVSAGVGILVAVIAAVGPARHASRIPPVDALREGDLGDERPVKARTIIGVVLVAIGAGAVYFATTLPDRAPLYLGLGALAILIGVLVASPIISVAVARLLAVPFQAFQPMGKLARGNVTRNPRRTANTAGALMVGMAIIGGALTLGASAQASVASIVDEDLKADFMIRGQNWQITRDVDAKIEALSDVADTQAVMAAQMQVDGQQTRVLSVPDSFFTTSLHIVTVEGSIDALAHGEVLVPKSMADDRGWKLGAQISLSYQAAGASEATIQQATIGGIYTSASLADSIVVPASVFDALVPEGEQTIALILVTAKDGVSLDQVKQELTDVVSPYYVFSVVDKADFKTGVAAQVDRVMIVLYALIALGIIIAVLGIANTLALSVAERRQEIGLVRAVGLGRAQLVTTVVIEAVVLALLGAVLGLALGVGLASVAPLVFRGVGLTTLDIPWLRLAIVVLGAAIVGLVAAILPAARAARLPVLRAITRP